MSATPVASAVVLAGGRSRRLGQDKRRLRLWGAEGPSLLERTVALAATLCPDVVVVLNDPEAWPDLPARLVGDRYPDGGALGGIASGLDAVADAALVLACDMPLLSRPLLAAMLARPRTYDALVPRSPIPGVTRNHHNTEPLHAIYSKRCLEPILAALAGGRHQIAAIFPLVRTIYIEPDEIRRYDPAGHAFLNVNTVAQMADAQMLLGRADERRTRPDPPTRSDSQA
jgi:molybdopterin-guanine dinucleotide biosynthesis protein A